MRFFLGILVLLVTVEASGATPSEKQTPAENLLELRGCGASVCANGIGIAMSVGRERWKAGNSGLKVVRLRLPKLIAFVTVYPIDEKPLTKEGLEHLASAPAMRRIRFVSGSIDDKGLSQFIAAANQNRNRPKQLVLHDVDITDASLESIKTYKGLTQLSVAGTSVSEKGILELKEAFPKCEIEFKE